MDDLNENRFERTMNALLPERDPSIHLDLVQNFRLYLENFSREEKQAMLDELKLPNQDGMTLRDELKEWAHMLAWDFPNL